MPLRRSKVTAVRTCAADVARLLPDVALANELAIADAVACNPRYPFLLRICATSTSDYLCTML